MQTFSKRRVAAIAIFAVFGGIFGQTSCAPAGTCLRYSDCSSTETCAAGKCVPLPGDVAPSIDATDAAPLDAATADEPQVAVEASVDDASTDAGDEPVDPGTDDAATE